MTTTPSPASATTVAGILDELKMWAATDHRYDWADAQLEAAIEVYADLTGNDLRSAPVTLRRYPLQALDRSYNTTPAGSVAQYRAAWVTSGRLHGPDLEDQVAWYASLVDAARAGALPPILVHETGTGAIIVDGSHRESAHRAAGLSDVLAYVAT